MMTMTTPAQTRVSAPQSLAGMGDVPADLAAAFAAPGYTVALDGADLIVGRADAMALPNDPGAIAPLVDVPFGAQERKNISGLIAAWEASA